MALLRQAAPEVAATVASRACIVEFGSGASHKIRVLLDALDAPARYIAIDISEDFLSAAANRIRTDYPGLDVIHVCADYSHDLPTLPLAPQGILGFLPGTSIGNMDSGDAQRLLARIKTALGSGWLLIGQDPNRDPARLFGAYGSGLMADLHENVLRRMVRELGAELSPDDFAHEARIIENPARVEAHLVAKRPSAIKVGGQDFCLAAGESIRTDVSRKYTPDEFRDLVSSAGWSIAQRWMDRDELFCLYLLRTA